MGGYRHEPSKRDRWVSSASDRAKNTVDVFGVCGKSLLINTPDTPSLTNVCYIPALQDVEKT